MSHEELIAKVRENIRHTEEGEGDWDAWERLANMAGPLADALEATEMALDAVAAACDRVREAALPRTVTTVEELDALPDGSVIKGWGVAVKLRDDDWLEAGCDMSTYGASILPAIVIFTPEGDNK